MGHSDSPAEVARTLDRIREEADKHTQRLVKLENRLGLQAGFVAKLIDEKDDWAFVIKTAVVLEAALADAIRGLLTSDGLDRHVRSLPMDGRTGKIQLAQDLGLLGPRAAARYRAIAEIRNDFAHGLKVVTLTLPGYFLRMSPGELRAVAVRLLSTDHESDTPKRSSALKDADRHAMFSADDRLSRYLVWIAACVALEELIRALVLAEVDDYKRRAMIALGQSLVARQQGDVAAAEAETLAARQFLEQALDSFPKPSTVDAPSAPGIRAK